MAANNRTIDAFAELETQLGRQAQRGQVPAELMRIVSALKLWTELPAAAGPERDQALDRVTTAVARLRLAAVVARREDGVKPGEAPHAA